MNQHLFKTLLARYIAGILGWLMLGCTAACLLMALFMIIGMMAGEWALLHVLAMFGMMAGFAVLAAVLIALHTALGGTFFGTEEKHEKTVD